MANRNWTYCLANFSGVVYSVAIILGVTGLSLGYTCPALYGEEGCAPYYWHALVILSELIGNLVLFHYFNVKNQVNYWTVKSSSIMRESEAEAMAMYDRLYDENDQLLAERGEYGSESDVRSTPTSSSPRHQHPPTTGRLVITSDGIYTAERPFEEIPKGPTKFCHECRKTMPRRSHHCPLCGICVLRKDHHCFLTGGCVGLANQRFFIVFLFWAVIGCAYGTYFTFAYMNQKLVESWFPVGWLRFVAPFALVRWLLGYDSLFNLMFAVVACASAASCLVAAGFLGAQMFYTLQGFTMHDYHVGRLRDQLDSDGENWSERLALVFGRRWWLNFIFPQFWLPNQMTPSIAKNIFLSVSKDL